MPIRLVNDDVTFDITIGDILYLWIDDGSPHARGKHPHNCLGYDARGQWYHWDIARGRWVRVRIVSDEQLTDHESTLMKTAYVDWLKKYPHDRAKMPDYASNARPAYDATTMPDRYGAF